jgi:hypothetical protein
MVSVDMTVRYANGSGKPWVERVSIDEESHLTAMQQCQSIIDNFNATRRSDAELERALVSVELAPVESEQAYVQELDEEDDPDAYEGADEDLYEDGDENDLIFDHLGDDRDGEDTDMDASDDEDREWSGIGD